MGTVFESVSEWLDAVHIRNKRACYRALNKASAKTQTQFRKLLQADTGLKAKDINARLFTRKAHAESLKTKVSFGTKVGIPLRLFKAKEKIVTIGRGKRRKRFKGVTVAIPAEGGRTLVPGGFFINRKNGKQLATSLVVARKTAARKPLEERVYNTHPIARKHRDSLTAFMKEDFNRQFKAQIKLQLERNK